MWYGSVNVVIVEGSEPEKSKRSKEDYPVVILLPRLRKDPSTQVGKVASRGIA